MSKKIRSSGGSVSGLSSALNVMARSGVESSVRGCSASAFMMLGPGIDPNDKVVDGAFS